MRCIFVMSRLRNEKFNNYHHYEKMVSLKEQKEQFVTGLLGGSIPEIYCLTGVGLSSYFCYKVITREKVFKDNFLIDFSLNCITLLLAITIYNGRLGLLHSMIIIPAFVIGLINGGMGKPRHKNTQEKTQKSEAKVKQFLPRKPFLTAYRAHMIMLTNLAVLAVDFRLFPRKYAKVETWGTSLMDLGVGSFVFSMGLVSYRFHILNEMSSERKSVPFLRYYLRLIKVNTVKALPILFLGISRLVVVKWLEYQEHTSEYGLHWNFFVTLGLMPIFLAILEPILVKVPRIIVGFAVAFLYEFLLQKGGIQYFILRTDNRMVNLLTMNKEGIFSFIGYFSIFIFGQSFAPFVLPGFKTPCNIFGYYSPETFKRKNFLAVTTEQGLLIFTIVLHLLFWICNESFLFDSISRRLVNLPYILWTVSMNSYLLLGYNLIEKLTRPQELKGSIIEATNKNGLACFLLGNVLTGAVNVSIDTLSCSSLTTLGILSLYGFICSVTPLILDKHGLYLKI